MPIPWVRAVTGYAITPRHRPRQLPQPAAHVEHKFAALQLQFAQRTAIEQIVEQRQARLLVWMRAVNVFRRSFVFHTCSGLERVCKPDFNHEETKNTKKEEVKSSCSSFLRG
jgi:hypothetical protein